MNEAAVIKIRWAVRRDIPAVIAIERETMGWHTPDEITRWFNRANTYVVVAVNLRNDEVMGFATVHITPKTLRVLDLTATHPDAYKLLVERMKHAAKAKPGRQLVWANC